MRPLKYILPLFISLFIIKSCDYKNHPSKLPSSFSESILSSKLLNSERIKMKFGSYKIKVLYKNSKLRVSDLYSSNDGRKTTRTFAVVQYPKTIDSIFLKEHIQILNGQSIGKVFKENQ